MRKLLLLVFMIGLSLLAVGCREVTEPPVETEQFAMGADVYQQVYGRNAPAAAQDVSAMISELDQLWTINSPGGDINRLNENAGGSYVQLDPRTIDILTRAGRISAWSDGTGFDITVGPLVKAWGIGTENAQVLTGLTVQRLVTLVDYRDVQVDAGSNSARLRREGQMVDLGGIAKGYAGDAAIDIYKKHGIESALANIGGNVVVLGTQPDGRPWRVGIQDPRGSGSEVIGVVETTDSAVVTSGDYQRYLIADGQRYCHIIDPQTGYPVDNDLMSVTILAPSSTDADGLAKAFVLGLAEGKALVAGYSGADAIFITDDHKIYITPGLQGKFRLEESADEYTLAQNR